MLDDKLANSLAVYLYVKKSEKNILEYPMPTIPLVTKERLVSPMMPTDVT
jgi:hypothetical protein